MSAGRLEPVLRRREAELDAPVSAPNDPALRAPQVCKEALRAADEKLSRSDETELRKGLKALYAD